MFIKKYCNPGNNIIRITVRSCCCSHQFTVQAVNRPTVRSKLDGTLSLSILSLSLRLSLFLSLCCSSLLSIAPVCLLFNSASLCKIYCTYHMISYQLKLIEMRAELANLNNCAVPFLSRAAANLCWHYYRDVTEEYYTSLPTMIQ